MPLESSRSHEHAHVAPFGRGVHRASEERHDEHAHHGHGDRPSQPSGGGHEHHHAEDFRRRFWISVALSIPVFAFSPMIRDWLGLPEVTGVQEAVAPVFGTLVFVYGGRPFLTGAIGELRARQPGMMMTLIGRIEQEREQLERMQSIVANLEERLAHDERMLGDIE